MLMKRRKIEELKWNRWVSGMSRVYNRNSEIRKHEDEKAEEVAVVFILSIWIITWIAFVIFLIS